MSGRRTPSHRVPKPGRSLAELRPDLADEWHSQHNGSLKPTDVMPGTRLRVWWKCDKGPDHEWQATLEARSSEGTGCPFCRGLRPSVTNSLAAQYPALAAQWHPTLNGDLTPDQVVAGSGRKVWWKCDKGPDHEWQAPVHNRCRQSNGRGCPFCRGTYASTTNSLMLIPALVERWHPDLNGDLTPDQVVAGSGRKVWWKCDKGPDHEWQATVSNMSRSDRGGCPFCRGLRPSVTNSLAAQYPALAAQWHPTLNGDLTPDQVVAGSHRKVWWKCDKGPDHEWRVSPESRTASQGACPFCIGQRVSTTNSLARFPHLATQWHPTLNGDLTPDQVVAGSGRKVWWKCDKGPDHEWQTTLNSRLSGGHGCPCCAGQQVSVTNSLATRAPELASQWHPTRNADLRPEQVVAQSNRKVWWMCPNAPDHEWQATLNNRWSGNGCPLCAAGGYSPSKPGTVYVLCGEVWGKVGISNTLANRLARHAANGIFGLAVVAVDFVDGRKPVDVESALCDFIAARTNERAPKGIDGYTESFPARMLSEVEAELRRLLDELPSTEWTVLDHPPPPRRSR
jgi:hypothetical protein